MKYCFKACALAACALLAACSSKGDSTATTTDTEVSSTDSDTLVITKVDMVDSEDNLADIVTGVLFDAIPNHGIDEEAVLKYTTADFANTMIEAFDLPNKDLDNEQLYYFICGQEGGPVIDDVVFEKRKPDSARAIIKARMVYGPDDDKGDPLTYTMDIVKVDGMWKVDEFNKCKKETKAFIKERYRYFSSGEYKSEEKYFENFPEDWRDYEKSVKEYLAKYKH